MGGFVSDGYTRAGMLTAGGVYVFDDDMNMMGLVCSD